MGIAPALEELPHGAEWRQCLSKPTAGKKKKPTKKPTAGFGQKAPRVTKRSPLLPHLRPQSQVYKAAGTSLQPWVVPWLRFCTPTAGGMSSIPGQGTRAQTP